MLTTSTRPTDHMRCLTASPAHPVHALPCTRSFRHCSKRAAAAAICSAPTHAPHTPISTGAAPHGLPRVPRTPGHNASTGARCIPCSWREPPLPSCHLVAAVSSSSSSSSSSVSQLWVRLQQSHSDQAISVGGGMAQSTTQRRALTVSSWMVSCDSLLRSLPLVFPRQQ